VTVIQASRNNRKQPTNKSEILELGKNRIYLIGRIKPRHEKLTNYASLLKAITPYVALACKD
jgi:hypothetical protein